MYHSITSIPKVVRFPNKIFAATNSGLHGFQVRVNQSFNPPNSTPTLTFPSIFHMVFHLRPQDGQANPGVQAICWGDQFSNLFDFVFLYESLSLLHLQLIRTLPLNKVDCEKSLKLIFCFAAIRCAHLSRRWRYGTGARQVLKFQTCLGGRIRGMAGGSGQKNKGTFRVREMQDKNWYSKDIAYF